MPSILNMITLGLLENPYDQLERMEQRQLMQQMSQQRPQYIPQQRPQQRPQYRPQYRPPKKIDLICPHCKAILEGTEEDVGRPTRCGWCKKIS
jgi:hypothetical protein